jgi:hypothetical protein
MLVGSASLDEVLSDRVRGMADVRADAAIASPTAARRPTAPPDLPAPRNAPCTGRVQLLLASYVARTLLTSIDSPTGAT